MGDYKLSCMPSMHSYYDVSAASKEDIKLLDEDLPVSSGGYQDSATNLWSSVDTDTQLHNIQAQQNGGGNSYNYNSQQFPPSSNSSSLQRRAITAAHNFPNNRQTSAAPSMFVQANKSYPSTWSQQQNPAWSWSRGRSVPGSNPIPASLTNRKPATQSMVSGQHNMISPKFRRSTTYPGKQHVFHQQQQSNSGYELEDHRDLLLPYQQVNYRFFSNRVERRRISSSSSLSRSSYHSSPSSTTTDTFVLTHRGLNSTEDESTATTEEHWTTTLAKFSSKFLPFPCNIRTHVKKRNPFTVELETAFDTKPSVLEKRSKSYKETNANGGTCYQLDNKPEKYKFRLDDQRGKHPEKWFSDTTSCFSENDHPRFESNSESQLYPMNDQSFHTHSAKMSNSTRHLRKNKSNRNDFLDHIKSKRRDGSSKKKCTKYPLKEQINSPSWLDLNEDFGNYKHCSAVKKVGYSVGKYKMKLLRNVVKKDILGENTKYLRPPISSDLSSIVPNIDLELEENFNLMPSIVNNKKHITHLDLCGPHKPNQSGSPQKISQRDPPTLISAKYKFINPYFDKEMISFPYNQPYVTNNDHTKIGEMPVKIEASNKERPSEPTKPTFKKNKPLKRCLDAVIEYQKPLTATKKSYDPYLLKDTPGNLQINQLTGKFTIQDSNNQHKSKKVTCSIKDNSLKEKDVVHNKTASECRTKQGKEFEKIEQGSLSRKNETSKQKDRKFCNTLNVKGQYLELKCQSEPCQTNDSTEKHAPDEELPESPTRCEEKHENHEEKNHHKQYLEIPTGIEEQNLKSVQNDQPTQSQQTNDSYTQTSRELLMKKIEDLIRPAMKEDDDKIAKGPGNVMNHEGTHTLLSSFNTLNSKRLKSLILENLHPNVVKVDEINNDNNVKCDGGGEDDIFKSYCDVYYVNKARNFQRKKLSISDKKKVRSNPGDDIFNENTCQTIYRNRTRLFERDVSDIHIK